MWSQVYFNNYAPLTGTVDDEFPLGNIADQWAARARALLTDLDVADVNRAIDLFDWMYSDYHQSERVFERLLVEATGPEPAMPSTTSILAGEALALKDAYDLETLENSGKMTWTCLFSLAGLNLIAEAYDEDLFQRKTRPANMRTERMRLDMAAFLLFPAVELIAAAESERVLVMGETRIESEVKDKISLRNQQAAITRHSRPTRLKNRFISWYYENKDSGTYHSKSQAAAKFYNNLPSEEKLFRDSNAQRTLLDALRAFEKAKGR